MIISTDDILQIQQYNQGATLRQNHSHTHELQTIQHGRYPTYRCVWCRREGELYQLEGSCCVPHSLKQTSAMKRFQSVNLSEVLGWYIKLSEPDKQKVLRAKRKNPLPSGWPGTELDWFYCSTKLPHSPKRYSHF